MVSLALPQSALQNWLRPERSSQLAGLANVLLVIWLAWWLADLSWLVVPEPRQQPLPQSAVAGTAAARQHQQERVSARQIAAWHIFGVAGESRPVKKSATVDAPETRLKLTLRGVFASDEPDKALAIIGDPRGKENHYAVGDPLPGGAKVSEIHPDRIILERNGRYETLRLPRKQVNSTAGAGGRTHMMALSNFGKAAAFSRYRREIKQNPAAFLNYVHATPARRNGKFIGFRLQPGKQRGALRELGLQPGDVVTSVNGVRIDSPAKGMRAMQSLWNSNAINVTLLRAGRETSMSLSVPHR